MEVLSNGMQIKFWIPVEEEPDIDRFIDEQIMIDMDRFMLVGTLLKVGTCKKKNEEKEYEYFKQLTVAVCNICSAADNNVNISVPTGKEEFLYEVKFRYAPEPMQEDEEPDLTKENDLELGYYDQHGNEVDRDPMDGVPDSEGEDVDTEMTDIEAIENEFDEEQVAKDDAAVTVIDDIMAKSQIPDFAETPEEEADRLSGAEAAELPYTNELDTEPDNEAKETPEGADNAPIEQTEPDIKPDNLDDDGINWGD